MRPSHSHSSLQQLIAYTGGINEVEPGSGRDQLLLHEEGNVELVGVDLRHRRACIDPGIRHSQLTLCKSTALLVFASCG